MSTRIDGKVISSQVLEEVKKDAAEFYQQFGIKPGLAVVLVGEDPASQVYVRNKTARATESGLNSIEYRLPEDTSEQTLNLLIEKLNNAPDVHGILVQLPLPDHLDEEKLIAAIAPEKDVDGFHPVNVGALSLGKKSLVPCTPQGCMIMLEKTLGDLSGKHAVVVGRSNIVGKPMASLLLKANCTVTVIHSRTTNPKQLSQQADILVAAVGSPEMIGKDWVKPGCTVIDVGINVIEREGKRKLVGDVNYAEVEPLVNAITPVPGGVGPMTIACLMRNTLIAARQQH
ncbi:bifunctional methylenetetrahydrofolate dehydrogenase/methenyltetrahydrofolate cyclohydrolase FolD [Oceanospirillum maris]|uniref:bifunctional methylenetetrahydrofolate dehydrogenase/methenyltetrahydrofolate cyclohydrolase FolD n=1 Tax=Oceanospirillum maris TaxID=64977 RepID=UPI0004180919|nr:bifunctional methylenetetrahydrofolate dehydrogenase/methenyltetrahydrofolate cyclohydrolase FolD [Oceanospirillum maris]